MELWKLRHRLFGTHFVSILYGFDCEICAVRFTPTGEPYVKFFVGERAFLLETHREWRALTFDKKKWIEAQKNRPQLNLVHSA
jgi:hypothetical protein